MSGLNGKRPRSGSRAPDVEAPAPMATCAPAHAAATIQLAHGGGGLLSRWLVEREFLPAFANPLLQPLHDGAVLAPATGRLAITTDSFVVRPLFFPGGDIGSLAVHGTLNDLAMCGARPLGLSLACILEEGLDFEVLRRIIASAGGAAATAGVFIVTGDTKVVDRGKADGVFITTTGIGVVREGIEIAPARIRPGDRILLSGAIAEHGVAILSVREGLRFETTIESDAANLQPLVERMLAAGGEAVHCLRDPTRGGVASVVSELASAARVGMQLHEDRIPVREDVHAACEMLGLDPLYVANEGKCIAFVAPERAGAVLAAMKAHRLGANAADIGEVTADDPGVVVLRTRIGGTRVVDLPVGELLPRIC